MNIIPTLPLAAQTFNVTLNGQSCVITIYQKSTGLYIDLITNNVVTLTTVLCLDRDRIVRSTSLGFLGDLAFIDTQGTADPQFSGLGSRWILAYLTPDEVAAL